MTDVKGWIEGAADEALGIVKRAVGELTARPDLVLEGERQQARGHAEIAASRGEEQHRNVGWKLDRSEREVLLLRLPPSYPEVVADHVTLTAGAPAEHGLPADVAARIVGMADDGGGVQAMVVAIDGTTVRPDGGTYHITWSLAPGRRASESNDVLAWTVIPEPIEICIRPARF
ncbi:CsbD family protein [Novosphingobium sp. JCM 18896]|uniref:CsbD family protein n=1 Tax=Novosphingobium sp. JCM 18896 TaxID=2989731 RepID=UPI0022225722|nr:CsbD family protein [Novosphingobium sp. JCM 18896]MCW1430212.1 CsbD family protein [Novosphingobium sp. JCM 18896]